MQLTPREIVDELDKYIIGQDARQARGRRRDSQPLATAAAPSDEIREEVTPKNIIMIGPTGVGKTEIARRLAKLVGCAVHQGGGHEVYRGGLSRARRRKHGSRSG